MRISHGPRMKWKPEASFPLHRENVSVKLFNPTASVGTLLYKRFKAIVCLMGDLHNSGYRSLCTFKLISACQIAVTCFTLLPASTVTATATDAAATIIPTTPTTITTATNSNATPTATHATAASAAALV